MQLDSLIYQKVKTKYLNFLKSQEVTSEPFRNKLKQLNNFYLPISKMIKNEFLKNKKTKVIGLTGGQGSGKSTISNILKIILQEGFNLKTVIFSIDDFYKTLKERKIMSKKISPLFLTRGVPGTHDTRMLNSCIKNFKNKKFKKTIIPKFDKSIDDRSPKSKWVKVNKKPNIVIFEGWCVGARAQTAKQLKKPINSLEKAYDQNSKWRSHVNNQLKTKYKLLFKQIDELLYLKAKNFDLLKKWRIKQERKLWEKNKNKKNLKIMKTVDVLNFMQTYHRITQQMFNDGPKISSVIMNLNSNHQIQNIKFKKNE